MAFFIFYFFFINVIIKSFLTTLKLNFQVQRSVLTIWSKNFINYICENNYNKYDKEIMEYVLRTFIFEFLKLAGNLIILSCLGYFAEALLITISTSSVKPFIGGYHCQSQFQCFLATFIIHLFIIILSQGSTLNFPALVIIIAVSFFAIYHQSPIINQYMPITKPELIKQNRTRGFFTLSIISITTIILYFYNIYYAYILTWSILSLSVLMFNRLSWKQNIK